MPIMPPGAATPERVCVWVGATIDAYFGQALSVKQLQKRNAPPAWAAREGLTSAGAHGSGVHATHHPAPWVHPATAALCRCQQPAQLGRCLGGVRREVTLRAEALRGGGGGGGGPQFIRAPAQPWEPASWAAGCGGSASSSRAWPAAAHRLLSALPTAAQPTCSVSGEM